jgi:hypothetical protein
MRSCLPCGERGWVLPAAGVLPTFAMHPRDGRGVLGSPRTAAQFRLRSGRTRPPSARAEANARLDAQVAAMHAGSKRSDGRSRIVRGLREQGLRVGHERVRRSLQRQASAISGPSWRFETEVTARWNLLRPRGERKHLSLSLRRTSGTSLRAISLQFVHCRRLRLLKGSLKHLGSVSVSGNWRLITRYDQDTNTASDLNLVDYH